MDKEISETLAAARAYLENLTLLQSKLDDALKQIITTSSETERDIKSAFANLRQSFNDILDKREKTLLEKAAKAKSNGLLVLTKSSVVVKEKIDATSKLIEQGSHLNNSKPDELLDFLRKGSLMGDLPEVPESKEVPYVSFYLDHSYEAEFRNICSGIGKVFKVAPIQISKLSPKPGAILVEWQQHDDKIRDIQEFRLQRAFGDVVKDKNLIVNFLDCYKGVDTQFLLRDIKICQPYSFRICCKFEETSEWSPWSIPQVASTALHWFSWAETTGIILTNENKIVRNEGNIKKIVYSNGAQVSLDDSVEFTILDIDQKEEACLALIQEKDENLSKIKDYQNGIFLIDSDGKISIDGSIKSTILPKFAKGLKVCFSLEKIYNEKIRVNVDVNDKIVTYDWNINDNSKLYFATQLASQWKFMVE